MGNEHTDYEEPCCNIGLDGLEEAGKPEAVFNFLLPLKSPATEDKNLHLQYTIARITGPAGGTNKEHKADENQVT